MTIEVFIIFHIQPRFMSHNRQNISITSTAGKDSTSVLSSFHILNTDPILLRLFNPLLWVTHKCLVRSVTLT